MRIGGVHDDRTAQRNDPGERNHQEGPACLLRQHQEQRPEQVELLFRRERPGVQQRQFVGRGGKVFMQLAPVLDVGDRQQRVRAFLGKVEEHQGRTPQRAQHIGEDDGEDQRRKNPPRPAHVGVRQGETAAVDIAQDVAADQIAGNNEEDVDPDKAAVDAADLEMEERDDDDRDRTQAGDFVSELAFHTRGSSQEAGVVGFRPAVAENPASGIAHSGVGLVPETGPFRCFKDAPFGVLDAPFQRGEATRLVPRKSQGWPCTTSRRSATIPRLSTPD